MRQLLSLRTGARTAKEKRREETSPKRSALAGFRIGVWIGTRLFVFQKGRIWNNIFSFHSIHIGIEHEWRQILANLFQPDIY